MNEFWEAVKGFGFEFRYVLVVLLGLIVWAIFNMEMIKKRVRSSILKGEKWAKEQAKIGVEVSGQQVEDWIIETLYPLIVGRWSVFIPESSLRNIIRFFYRKLVDALDDGKINNSIGGV